MINKFDIIYFSETKTDETDIITFPGYYNILQPWKQINVRKLGAIAVYYKKGISLYIKAIETQSDYIYSTKKLRKLCLRGYYKRSKTFEDFWISQ